MAADANHDHEAIAALNELVAAQRRTIRKLQAEIAGSRSLSATHSLSASSPPASPINRALREDASPRHDISINSAAITDARQLRQQEEERLMLLLAVEEADARAYLATSCYDELVEVMVAIIAERGRIAEAQRCRDAALQQLALTETAQRHEAAWTSSTAMQQSVAAAAATKFAAKTAECVALRAALEKVEREAAAAAAESDAKNALLRAAQDELLDQQRDELAAARRLVREQRALIRGLRRAEDSAAAAAASDSAGGSPAASRSSSSASVAESDQPAHPLTPPVVAAQSAGRRVPAGTALAAARVGSPVRSSARQSRATGSKPAAFSL